MMKRYIIFMMLCALGLGAQAQPKIRDLFASAPDSIFPLLTTNNRLDCLDFMENKMVARVKNRLDDVCEMKTLTDDYLMMQMSARSSVEMRLLSDSLFCLVNTRMGPAPDSRVRFYDAQWQPVEVAMPQPTIADFWQAVPDSVASEARFVQLSLEALRLVQVTAQTGEPVLSFTLQTSELSREERELAQRYVHPLRYRWDGQAF